MGDTVATDTDTVLATTTDTTARGPLTPSPPPLLRPRLMLIPTTDTTAWATMVLDTAPTDTVLATTATDTVCTDTTDKCPADSRQLRNYIKFKRKMDRSVWFDPHQCYQFQCHQA